MKKIIAMILALLCVFAVVSCGDDEEIVEKTPEEIAIEATLACYAASAPTKVVTKSVRDFGADAYKLNADYVLVTGRIDGKIATVRTYSEDRLLSVEDGSGSVILNPIQTFPGSDEYLEGKGRRVDGGAWIEDGLNFAPTAGSLTINITKDNVTDITYSEAKFNNVLSFTIAYDKVDEVFGTDADENSYFDNDSDVKVTITNDGAVITRVVIEYSIEEDDEYPAQSVVIDTTYSYDLEAVTLVK